MDKLYKDDIACTPLTQRSSVNTLAPSVGSLKQGDHHDLRYFKCAFKLEGAPRFSVNN